ncbi:MAG: hypothetical protein IJ685_07170 [Selenomonadaceae bacterium]|nr:hypothetical protein [Selenomonadaceae bacterium]
MSKYTKFPQGEGRLTSDKLTARQRLFDETIASARLDFVSMKKRRTLAAQ